ncbi:LamB/YcsF family protein [Hoyosella subflava]|uniref:5-oxoprolinase subunit A n=1 Tax=Hoyosella subflava (strain DSM 45089 / JCM 17490 / NBRC 109087 / DQS3-9A1) TaxID=443218 RepID=F6EKD4_HOYSD|nr:5-oxoprolinase subunit PxpA [Hoyosella subflava]AEF39105.1 hypothetical protein AS9A_0651 [Hoyosella subflava DQS3-9A1]
MAAIDLNCDLGESFGIWALGDDAAMLPLVTSANIACGFHAGDARTLLITCQRAVDHGVRIGAQVSYRDLAGFGRRFIEVAPDELTADVLYQIGALDGLARVAGDRVRYVKPHGALYNAAVHHEEQAAAVVDAVAQYDRNLPILGLPGSALLRLAADAGLRTVTEAFADRAYTAHGALVPRREPGAVLSDATEIAARAYTMVTTHQVVAEDETVLDLHPESLCVHGDTPGAVEIAAMIREKFDAAGVVIAPFT